MRIAILADIHSNFPALRAVVDDLASQRVDEVIVAGDAINGAPFPREVLDTIYGQQWATVLGNHEQYMLDCNDPTCTLYPRELWRSFYWSLDKLTAADLAWMAQLPTQLERDDLLIVHASPAKLNWGVLPSTPDDTLHKQFGAMHHRYIITAHTHVPFVCAWRDKLIINPGSVGMSFDGTPAASYAILTRLADGTLRVEHRRVAYDVQAVLEAADQRGLLATDVFARNVMRQIATARPRTHALLMAVQQIQDREQVDLLTAMDQVDLDVLEPDYDYTFTRRNTNRPKPPSPAQLGQNITVHKP